MHYAIYQLKSCVDKYKYLDIDMRDFAQSMQDNLRDYINLNDFEIIKSGIFEEDFSDAQRVVDCGYGQLKYDIDRLDVIHTWWNQRYEALPRDWKGDLTASYEYIVQLNGHYYLRHYSKYQKKYWSQIDRSLLNKYQSTQSTKKISQKDKRIITIITIIILAIAITTGSITGIVMAQYAGGYYSGACPFCNSHKVVEEYIEYYKEYEGLIYPPRNQKEEATNIYIRLRCDHCGHVWKHEITNKIKGGN